MSEPKGEWRQVESMALEGGRVIEIGSNTAYRPSLVTLKPTDDILDTLWMNASEARALAAALTKHADRAEETP